MNIVKKVIISGSDVYGARIEFREIVNSLSNVEFAVVITEGLYYRKSNFASIIKLILESSVLFCAVRALEIFLYKLKGDTIEKYCRQHDIKYLKTRDINGTQAVKYLKEFGPDLLVSLYTMHLYREPSISVPKYGAINCHPSILPDYRGLEVFFWAMVNDEKTTGASVFFMTEKLDDGLVIRDEVVELKDQDSMRDVYDRVTKCGAKLLVQSIRDIDNNEVRGRIPGGNGRYFPMPTRMAVWKFLKKGNRFF